MSCLCAFPLLLKALCSEDFLGPKFKLLSFFRLLPENLCNQTAPPCAATPSPGSKRCCAPKGLNANIPSRGLVLCPRLFTPAPRRLANCLHAKIPSYAVGKPVRNSSSANAHKAGIVPARQGEDKYCNGFIKEASEPQCKRLTWVSLASFFKMHGSPGSWRVVTEEGAGCTASR